MWKKTWNLYAVNGMYYVTTSLFSPYISSYYTSRGMSESQIGALSAIIPLCYLLIQPFWARISDRTGKRRRVLLFLCAGCAAAVLLFLKAESFPQFMIVVFIYSVFFSALLPLSDALTMREAERKKADFSRIRMSGTLCYALVVVASGFFLKSHLRVMFILDGIAFLIFLLCCSTLKDENAGEKNQLIKKGAENINHREPLFRSKMIIIVLTCAFALQLSLNYHGTFLGVYLLDLGHNQVLIGIMSCISALSEVPALLLMKKLYRKFSTETLLVMAVLLGAVRLVLAASGWIVLLLVEQLLQGFSFMICYLTCVTYINEQVQKDRISQGQSMLSLAQNGLGAICGTLIGGVVAQNLGIQRGFLVMAGIAACIAVCAAFAGQWIRSKEGGKYNEI